MDPITLLATMTAANIGFRLLGNYLAGQSPVRKELERVAREGIMSPEQRHLFYRQLRGEALSSANVVSRAGASAMGNVGLTGGLGTALQRDIASGTASQIIRGMTELEKYNLATRLQGLSGWAQYQQWLTNLLTGTGQQTAGSEGLVSQELLGGLGG